MFIHFSIFLVHFFHFIQNIYIYINDAYFSKIDNIHIIMDKIICYSLKIHMKLLFIALTKVASKISKQQLN